MAKLTLQERFIAALEQDGQRVVSRTRKRVTMTRSPCLSTLGLPATFYFIGNAGSLRVGEVFTRSWPASDKLRRSLLESA